MKIAVQMPIWIYKKQVDGKYYQNEQKKHENKSDAISNDFKVLIAAIMERNATLMQIYHKPNRPKQLQYYCIDFHLSKHNFIQKSDEFNQTNK